MIWQKILSKLNNLPKIALLLVLAQGLSSIGSSIASFSLDIWIYKTTGSYTSFALIAMISALPNIIFSPLAGVIVDKFPKKKVLLACECYSLLGLFIVLITLGLKQLNVKYIAAAVIILSSAETLRWPALSATISMLTPIEHLARVNGLNEMNSGIASILGPLLGALTYIWPGVAIVIVLDAMTYVFCIFMLILITLPIVNLPGHLIKQSHFFDKILNIVKDCSFGFQWIYKQHELLNLLLLFVLINVSLSIFWVVYTPYLLSFTTTYALGKCFAAGGIGILVSGLFFSAYGDLKHKVNGVLAGAILAGLCMVLFGILHASFFMYLVAFFHGFAIPMMNISNQTIWQIKVPTIYQGRVFSIRKMIALGINPIAIFLSIPLTTLIFKPIIDNSSNTYLKTLWGIGPTGAYGLMISSLGVLCIIVAIALLLIWKITQIVQLFDTSMAK